MLTNSKTVHSETKNDIQGSDKETQAVCVRKVVQIAIAALLEYLDHFYAHFVLVSQI